MDWVAVVLSSTLVSAVVGAGAGYLAQRSLATRQATLDYEYQARRRLYEAVGPLRFQLLISCRDVVRRVSGHVRAESWNMDPAAYYGHNTLYRLLRPLAVCRLIERQMNAADFSVDHDVLELLKFEVGAYRILTNRDPLRYHDHLDWSRETQHVFRDNLARASTALIKDRPDGGAVVVDYAEFLDTCPDPVADDRLRPLALILRRTEGSMARNAVFWVRVVGYAYLCEQFLTTRGSELGFADRRLDVAGLLRQTTDPQVIAHADEQAEIYRTISTEGL